MRKLIIATFLTIFAAFPVVVEADTDEHSDLRVSLTLNRKQESDFWFGRDKARHLIGSFILTGAMSWIIKNRFEQKSPDNIFMGAGTVLFLGIAKESVDRKRHSGTFSWKDIIADLIGICLGALLLGWW